MPMLVTLLPKVMLVMVAQSMKAFVSILVTLLGTVQLPALPPGYWMSLV